ncbi:MULTISPECIES: ABC-2 transporter permease [Turicibacter]|jgi:putative membrane protein|uniref:ABC-2 transporter permease n=2 Tax=Turicibacter sanguinis TaxID=154288 RepID=A0A9X4XG62_9FIRM|nr:MULTISPECIES: ABC-2 transporter permease [Turicibacter]KAB6704320.1 ABC-2 transporter permease [Phocaeicola vulgatus]EFF65256.1 putative membrane protein [Turicibacter sanguinis PC909]EGC91663.1 putative membrane protein [Turicibacter sp. HGF1]MBP3905406.1 ABC-2 transporter permease [Turicibacter sp.]MCU7190300.1 ABC-2 transporter permease [Turicibacter sanguinis]
MKGLILKDLLNLRKNLKTIIIMCLFYTLLFSTLNPTFLSGMITILFAMQILTTFSYDDYSKWNMYALSLPITKKQLVLSKYILGISFIIFGGVFSFILTSLLSLFKGSFILGDLVASIIGSTGIMILMILILLPLIFKYGVERSRIMLLAIFAIPTVLILIISKVLALTGIPFPSEEQLNALLPVICIIATLILIAGSYVSYMTSVKIVTKKEY